MNGQRRAPGGGLPDYVVERWVDTIRMALAGLSSEEFSEDRAADRESLLAAIHVREEIEGRSGLADAWILPTGEHAAHGDAQGRAVAAWIEWYRERG